MVGYLEILCGVTIALVAFYYYLIARQNFWKDRRVPGPEPTLAFGNVLKCMMGREALPEFLTRIYEEYKEEPMVGIFLRTKPVLLVKDPELIKDVLIKDFSKFANRGFLKSIRADPLSEHLFALEAKRWRPLRTHLSPVFTSGKLRETFSLILECSNHLEQCLDAAIEKGNPIEVRELAARFTTDVIGSCAFGVEMNSLSDQESEFRRVGKEIFATHFTKILKVRVLQLLPRLYEILCYVLPVDMVTETITRITRETMEYRRKNNVVRHDFINVLLELKNHPEKIAGVELTDNLLAAQAFVFFAAGFETSSTTIGNALYELAFHRDVQNKLRDEIREFEKRNGGEWRYESIKEMKYLHQVFQETLRKYPALPFLSRETVEDYTFDGTKVSLPKGSMVWIPVFPIHRDPNVYPDPEKFDPERFSDEGMNERHVMHYLPFGHGPRNCIGARFAVYQTKIGLIKILRDHRVDVCEKTPRSYKYNPFSFILTPTSGVYLNVTKLES